MKAALALDTLSNVTHGFAALLIGDCFEDVIITTVNVSQKSYPLHRRVPKSDASSTAYSDHVEPPAEIVPSALDLRTGGTSSSLWIVTFILITVLSTLVCVCVGLKCIGAGRGSQGTASAYANYHAEEENNNVATPTDGSVLGTPRQPPVYDKENRMFSPGSDSAKDRPRKAKAKRAALNARSAPNYRGNGKGSTQDFEVLSSGSEASSTEEPVENPLFASPGGSAASPAGSGVSLAGSGTSPAASGGARHVPRLSALDFGNTVDEDTGDTSDVAYEFWRRRHRGANDAS